MKNLNDIIKEANQDQPIIDAMKNALKEEFNAWYGYIIVKEWLAGYSRPDIVNMYEETAKDELEDHGYWLMKRIKELGGSIEDISNSPATWLTAVHTYISPVWKDNNIATLESIQTNINNEKGAIETYKELVNITEKVDPTTNSKCKEILADEEEHLQLLENFLNDYKAEANS